MVLGHQFVEFCCFLQRDQPDQKAVQYLLLVRVRTTKSTSAFFHAFYYSMGKSLFR
jgi:hypothetical protein